MRIKVKDENTHLNLWLPTSVLSWQWIWKMGLKKSELEGINEETVKKICKEFRKVRRYFKGLEVVHVESKDKTFVSIKI